MRTSVLVFLLYIRTFLSVAADLLFLNGDDLVPASEIGPFKVSDVTVSGISSGGEVFFISCKDNIPQEFRRFYGSTASHSLQFDY